MTDKAGRNGPLTLYGYWRSSAAYRVRIALNLKGLDYNQTSVHLVRDGGEQHQDAYRAINPQGRVPALLDGKAILTQSLAIIEYLEEIHPEPSLLPAGPLDRARVRALAQVVACDIHPLNNLGVLQYLSREVQLEKSAIDGWYRHWIERGFSDLEAMLAVSADTGRCCFGDRPGLADICLVPQVFNAERFSVDMEPFPIISRITAYCRQLEAFQRAAPEQQADAEQSG